jgi:hypothetical protein
MRTLGGGLYSNQGKTNCPPSEGGWPRGVKGLVTSPNPSQCSHSVLFRTVVQSVSKRLTFFSLAFFFCPEDGGDTFLRNVDSYKIPPGATSQKTPFFIVIAVKASNPTKLQMGLKLSSCLIRCNYIFLIPFYLQAVHVHLANGVNLK